jgi:hypothetical protein
MGENEVDTMLRDNFLIDAELNFCSTTSSLTKPFTASEFCSSVGVGRLTRVCIASKLALIVSRHQTHVGDPGRLLGASCKPKVVSLDNHWRSFG